MFISIVECIFYRICLMIYPLALPITYNNKLESIATIYSSHLISSHLISYMYIHTLP